MPIRRLAALLLFTPRERPAMIVAGLRDIFIDVVFDAMAAFAMRYSRAREEVAATRCGDAMIRRFSSAATATARQRYRPPPPSILLRRQRAALRDAMLMLLMRHVVRRRLLLCASASTRHIAPPPICCASAAVCALMPCLLLLPYAGEKSYCRHCLSPLFSCRHYLLMPLP